MYLIASFSKKEVKEEKENKKPITWPDLYIVWLASETLSVCLRRDRYFGMPSLIICNQAVIFYIYLYLLVA